MPDAQKPEDSKPQKTNKSKDAKNYYLRALELDKNNPILIKKASPE